MSENKRVGQEKVSIEIRNVMEYIGIPSDQCEAFFDQMLNHNGKRFHSNISCWTQEQEFKKE